MMKRKIICLLAALHFAFSTMAQKGELPEIFLGFGWIVGFGYDRAFVPSEKLNRVPTVNDFFNERAKYGVRVNEEQNAYEALQHGKMAKIKRDGKTDTLYITPVVAFFKMHNEGYKPKEKLEMLQIFRHKGKQDSVFYRFDIDFELHLSVIK